MTHEELLNCLESNLKKRLKELGKTQKWLADKLGEKPANLNEKLKGKRTMSTITLAQIAELVEMKPSHLLRTIEDAETEEAKDKVIADLLRRIQELDK